MSGHKYAIRAGFQWGPADPNAVHEPATFGPSYFSPDVIEYCTGCFPDGVLCGECLMPAADHGSIGCPKS